MKKRWMEQQEEERDKKLAEQLGITPDELNEIDWYLYEDTDNEGNTINHVFAVRSGPQGIIKKVKGLINNRVIVDMNNL